MRMIKLVNKIAGKLYPENNLVSATKFLKFVSFGNLKINWHSDLENGFCITEIYKKEIILNLYYKLNDRDQHFNMLKNRIPVILSIADKLTKYRINFKSHLLDGGEVSEVMTSFSSQTPFAILIPDPFFFNSNGYEKEKNYFKKFSKPWDKRKKLIVWRGAPSGQGIFTLSEENQDFKRINLRLYLVRKLINYKFADVRLTDVPQYFKKEYSSDTLRQVGIIGDYISWRNWTEFKYAIDIDGHTNAWSNFQQKLLSGCCVLKVESVFGFKQWFYDRLIPFEHYVPIKSDLSNLFEIIDWCFENEEKSRQIAKNGQHFAMSMCLNKELAGASDHLLKILS